jgi:superfamily II DNA or RNA helicase
MIKPRDYQHKAIQDIRTSYIAGNKSPLLVLPTGGGKTIVFSYIAATTAARSKKVLILVHRVELLRQTSDKLNWAGVRHGLVNPQYTQDLTATVQVASVQTLVRRLAHFKRFFVPDLIIIDEAHHATAGTWRKIVEEFPTSRVLGVTATPVRGDGKGLGVESGGIFDDMVIGTQVQELIDMGFLVKPIIYAPADKLDLTGVRTKMGDYDKHEIEIRVDKPSITGNAVQHYRNLCNGVPAVAFCVSIKHAEHVAAEFRANGYRAYAVDGGMEDDVRKKILNGLGNGTVDVVASCDLISEGTDIPAIGCAILLRPTQSTGLYIQQVGRALRPCEGKEYAIILDHVGNVITHGLPEEFREWSLDGEERSKKKSAAPKCLVKQCPSCYMMHKPAPSCPSCGHIYVVEARELEERDGELQQITPEAAALLRKQRGREVAGAKTLEDLQRIEKERGYKPGWAKHVYMSRNKKETGI